MKLDSLRNIPGMIASVLVSSDGLPIESVGGGSEALAAELASIRGGIERISRRLGAGRVTRIAFTSERMEVVAIASGHYILGAALARGTDTRLAQQALARLALEIVELPILEEA